MWTFEIASGKLFDDNGMLLDKAYSGFGKDKDIPQDENVPNMGPIPPGYYTFGEVENSSTHGPFAIPLIPDVDNQMFGRSGFMIHGDSILDPGDASKGCIITSLNARTTMYGSEDHRLHVV